MSDCANLVEYVCEGAGYDALLLLHSGRHTCSKCRLGVVVMMVVVVMMMMMMMMTTACLACLCSSGGGGVVVASPTVPIVKVLPLPVCRAGCKGRGRGEEHRECDVIVQRGQLLLLLHLPVSKHSRVVSCALVSIQPHPQHTHALLLQRRHL